MSKFVKNSILGILFLISISSILQWTILPINNTMIWWAIYIIILYLISKANIIFYEENNRSNYVLIKIYLTWNIICIIRGFFVAEDYWEWKQLIGSSMVLLLPLLTYLCSNSFITQKIISKWTLYIFPFFILIAPFILPGAYGRFLIPISFILLFFPLLNKQWKTIGIIVAFFVIFTNLGARSNVIKFLIPLLLSFVYYFKKFIGNNILIYLRLFLLFIPFLLLFLAITDVFNIFRISDYVEGEYKIESNAEWEGDGDLTVDTRTFIYVEVISSAIKHDYIWFGRTPARGNESPYFGAAIDKELNRNKNERFANEVGIANIFTWTGLIGVFLNFMIFVKATYMGLKKSRSWSIKILAIYVSFRWFYSWVEDFSRFDLSTVFLWLCIAMCLSNSFRNMNDEEFKNWFRGIFDKRYSKQIFKRQLVISEKK